MGKIYKFRFDRGELFELPKSFAGRSHTVEGECVRDKLGGGMVRVPRCCRRPTGNRLVEEVGG